MEDKLSPVVKWAGGKTQIMDKIKERLPVKYNDYYEPFLGGASVLFSLQPRKGFVNDKNQQLINLYLQIKENAEAVIDKITKLDNIPTDSDLYYSLRNQYNEKIKANELDIECAVLMIWLNKHSFNGLYRVNSQGLLNIPFNGKTSGKSIQPDNIRNISKYLNTTDITITSGDYTELCKAVKPGDFVYFDSPYIPYTKAANFTSYTKDAFSEKDHINLANLFKTLNNHGAYLMLSNNDVDMVYKLYSGFHIDAFPVKRLINRDASKRESREVIITNY